MKPEAVQGQLDPIEAEVPVGIGGVGRIRLDQAAGAFVHPQVERGADAQVEPAAGDGLGVLQVELRALLELDAIVAPGTAVLEESRTTEVRFEFGFRRGGDD